MLHIIFNSEYTNTDQLFILSVPKKIRRNCVEVMNHLQFTTLIKFLHPDTKIIIWIHIGTILSDKHALKGMVIEYAKEAEEFLDENSIEFLKVTRDDEIASRSKDIKYTLDMYEVSQLCKKYTAHELMKILSLDVASNLSKTIKATIDTQIDERSVFPKFKYAVITALFDSEFEELQKIFDFPKEEYIKTKKKVFYKGYFKKDRNIEIIAAVPNATGMLDSSVLATMMCEYFKPDYLLMSGVCGGAEKTDFGDIILAKQIFTFQKGKISDLHSRNDDGTFSKIELFDSTNRRIDYNDFFDKNGKQVQINVEKFEVEHDTMIPLDSLFEDSLNPELKNIKKRLNDIIEKEHFFTEKKIDIKVEPIACSTMVINKEGYFENIIKPIHRKTAAVEMESYGVARACHYANNGNTTPIIFKSVMDKTVDKEDKMNGINVKKFAAFTSAQFMGLLFENKII